MFVCLSGLLLENDKVQTRWMVGAWSNLDFLSYFLASCYYWSSLHEFLWFSRTCYVARGSNLVDGWSLGRLFFLVIFWRVLMIGVCCTSFFGFVLFFVFCFLFLFLGCFFFFFVCFWFFFCFVLFFVFVFWMY